MKIIFALIHISCHGHTNAVCYPSAEFYPTRDACEAARILPAQTTWLGREIPARIDPATLCLPVPEEVP